MAATIITNPAVAASAPALKSASVVVKDASSGEFLVTKDATTVRPIASITKLMTAMVLLDAKLPMKEPIEITADDVDTLRGSHSRLQVGSVLSRQDLLKLALMSSENRAAHALARTFPKGEQAFIAAMNAKARSLGLKDTHFRDPTGLTAENVSTARDLALMVGAAASYPQIQALSTSKQQQLTVRGRPTMFVNTNPLVRGGAWQIQLSKTGFIGEAGRCLVMKAKLKNRPAVIVLLDSPDKGSRVADAQSIKRWVERRRA